MKVRNINPKLGDSVEFDSLEEMISALKSCGSDELSTHADNLVDGVDYEEIDD